MSVPRPRLRRTLGLAAAVALAWAVPVAAAPTWTQPAVLSNPAANESFPDGAVNARGDAAAVWLEQAGGSYSIRGASHPAGGAWSGPGDVAAKVSPNQPLPLRVVVAPDGTATAVWRRQVSNTVQAAVKAPGADWSGGGDVADGASEYALAVAIGRDGAVYAAYSTGTQLRVVSRPPGGAWGDPEPVANGSSIDFVDLAVGADDRPIVAFTRGASNQRQVLVSGRAANGVWLAAEPVTDGNQKAASFVHLAVGAAGDAAVVWRQPMPATGDVVAAYRPAGGGWEPPVTVGQPDTDAFTEGRVAVDGQGTAVVVWSTYSQENSDPPPPGVPGPVVAAEHARGGTWSAPIPLGPPSGGYDTEVVSSAAGRTIVTWRDDTVSPAGRAAIRSPGGGWGEPIVAGAPGQDPLIVRPAVAPTGDTTFVWENGQVGVATLDVAGPVLGGLQLPTSAVAGQPVAFSVAASDVWSALGTTSWTFGDGAAADGAAVAHTYAAPGTYAVGVTSADAGGNATTGAGTITVTAPPATGPGTGPPTPAAPRVSRLTQTNPRWRRGTRRAFIAAARPSADPRRASVAGTRPSANSRRASSAAARPPVGTRFTFRLDRAARVRFAFARRASGRRSGRRCVAPTRRNRGRKRCTRSVAAGALSFAGHAGVNRVRFAGRLSRRKRLRTGRHVLAVTATADARRSRAARLRFRVVAG